MRLFFVFFIFNNCFLFAQKQLCFLYDNAGNQTNISICLNHQEEKNLLKKIVSEEKEVFDQKDEIQEEIILKAAPNPTDGSFFVYWHHYENKGLVRLFISSADMRILYDNTSIYSPMQQLEVNIFSYVPGVYYLVGIFADGSKKTFRIIKK